MGKYSPAKTGEYPRINRRPANHPFSQSVDWIAKGAAHQGRTEGAVLPVRCSAPEHDRYMTSEHSTTARWIRLGVNFEEGGNRSALRKPSKSGWDQLKLNPHRTFVVEVEGVIDVHYASLASCRVQHKMFYLEGANCNHFFTSFSLDLVDWCQYTPPIKAQRCTTERPFIWRKACR